MVCRYRSTCSEICFREVVDYTLCESAAGCGDCPECGKLRMELAACEHAGVETCAAEENTRLTAEVRGERADRACIFVSYSDGAFWWVFDTFYTVVFYDKRVGHFYQVYIRASGTLRRRGDVRRGGEHTADG